MLNGLLQPTVIPGAYEVEVHENAFVNTPANPPGPIGAPPRTTVVTDHFRESPGTHSTIFPRGVWGEGFAQVDVRYVVGTPLDPERRIISGRNINLTGIPSAAGPFINVLGWTDILPTAIPQIADGHIDAHTNGHITLTEEQGDLRAGEIQSTQRNVTLVARNHDIVDALDDDDADVIGVNLLLTALEGAIGSFANALEINSSSPTFGVVKEPFTPVDAFQNVDTVSATIVWSGNV